jgi:hypothetical protein
MPMLVADYLVYLSSALGLSDSRNSENFVKDPWSVRLHPIQALFRH